MMAGLLKRSDPPGRTVGLMFSSLTTSSTGMPVLDACDDFLFGG